VGAAPVGIYSKDYANLGLTGTYYLQFRDIPKLLNDYANNKNKVLDYGGALRMPVSFPADNN
jgi:hypothetical protein